MYRCNDVIDYLKDKIRKELDSVDCNKVALYSGYSIKQTNRIFSAQTAMNLGEYIKNRRMAQALIDLRYTDLSIIHIAQNNGFETQESFTRAFKSAFHITPNKFREYGRLECSEIDKALNEVIEEASHENARNRKLELPEPTVQLVMKPRSLWYSLQRNTNNLFPHDFYTKCQKKGFLENINRVSNATYLEGVYLTHVYIGQKFSSLTLGFDTVYKEDALNYDGFTVNICPQSEYLVVNVPPYMNYELGGHVKAAWDVFSNFNYSKYNLKRDLDHAPIFELDSVINGYTLYFPVTII